MPSKAGHQIPLLTWDVDMQLQQLAEEEEVGVEAVVEAGAEANCPDITCSAPRCQSVGFAPLAMHYLPVKAALQDGSYPAAEIGNTAVQCCLFCQTCLLSSKFDVQLLPAANSAMLAQ